MNETATEINDPLCKYLNCNCLNSCESNRKCSICWIGRAEKTAFDSDVIGNIVTSRSLYASTSHSFITPTTSFNSKVVERSGEPCWSRTETQM